MALRAADAELMKVQTFILNFATLIATLFSSAVFIYVTYDIFARGAIPPKTLELYRSATINPLKDLSALNGKESVTIEFGNESVNKIYIVKNTLKNVGESPIVPEDYHEPFRVSVGESWRILAVTSPWTAPHGINFKWKRVSDSSFEASKELLNPNDLFSTNIYVISTQDEETKAKTEKREPEVKWSARIKNLKEIIDRSKEEKKRALRSANSLSGIIISLGGWAVPFLIFFGLLFHSASLHLIFQANLLKTLSIRSMALLLAASFLSFAAAEVCATYIFPSYLLIVTHAFSHWVNLPFLLAYLFMIGCLYRASYRAQLAIKQ